MSMGYLYIVCLWIKSFGVDFVNRVLVNRGFNWVFFFLDREIRDREIR